MDSENKPFIVEDDVQIGSLEEEARQRMELLQSSNQVDPTEFLPTDTEEGSAKKKKKEKISKIYTYSCTVMNGVISVLLMVLCIVFAAVFHNYQYIESCSSSCTFQIVESIPVDIHLDTKDLSISTHEAVLDLVQKATKKLIFLEFYFTLNNTAEEHARGDYGLKIFKEIINAKVKRGVHVEIIRDGSFLDESYNQDLKDFEDVGIIVKTFNFTEMFGKGMMHTKLILVDNDRFYIGSSNMDWRSFSQVEELGMLVTNCECLHKDLHKIYDIYRTYPEAKGIDFEFDTKINSAKPIKVKINEEEGSTVYFSASPPALNSKDRTNDLDAYLDILESAENYVLMSVMSMTPFNKDLEYWDELDRALKQLLFKNMTVSILLSNWNHTSDMQKVYQKTLNEFGKICQKTESDNCLGRINVKQMIIPKMEKGKEYPYTRVNHAKYVVSEKDFLVGTNNWEMQYFYETAGISLIVRDNKKVRQKMEDIFWRNWNSNYAHEIV